jgi:hypothetical protein
MTNPLRANEFQFSLVGKHPFVEVPWHSAEALRDRLVAAGIPATACYDPTTRTAGLEILVDVDAQTLQSVLSA